MEEIDTTARKKRNIFLTRRQIRYAVVTTVVLLMLLGLATAFVLRVYFMTESSCYDDLAVETEDCIADLEANLRSDRMTLRVIAGLISNADDIDSIEVSGYLANYDINSLITQIGILLPEDQFILSNGKHSKVNGSVSFNYESALREHISSPQPSATNSNTSVIRSYVPVRKDGICIGLLYSAANPSNIAKAWLPGIYNKNGYCYVVNRKTGEVIINSSTDDIKDIHDIPFRQTDPSYTKEGTIKNILDGKKGYSVYDSGTESEILYMCYLPFSIEDWEMVVFVPESAVFSAVSPVRNGMYSMIVAVVVILLIYAIWLIREIRVSIAETEEKANIDALTGLQNRNRYEKYLKKLEGSKDKLTCIYIDANGLHELNNSQGHFAGDQMLRFIADTLKVQFGEEHIYRIGGDEFIVMIPKMSGARLNECLKHFHESLERNDYHAAVGTSTYEQGGNVDELIKNAEKDMYEAKKKYYEQIGKTMRV